MKKYFLLGLIVAIAPNVCFGGGARYTQLVREKQRKMEELEKCMGATNGLKIAGLSTIGLTAVGVAGNVAQAKKLDEYESGIESKQKELEKVNKDIAEKEAENKKAKEAEAAAAAAAAQKKAEEEAIAIYKTNCLKTGGIINENGTCICPDNSSLTEGGFCKKQIEVVSVKPNIDGQELIGVDMSSANNLYTWNSGLTNDGQDSTPLFPNQQNNDSSAGKTGASATSNDDKTAKPEDKSANKTTNQTVSSVIVTPAQTGGLTGVTTYPEGTFMNADGTQKTTGQSANYELKNVTTYPEGTFMNADGTPKTTGQGANYELKNVTTYPEGTFINTDGTPKTTGQSANYELKNVTTYPEGTFMNADGTPKTTGQGANYELKNVTTYPEGTFMNADGTQKTNKEKTTETVSKSSGTQNITFPDKKTTTPVDNTYVAPVPKPLQEQRPEFRPGKGAGTTKNVTKATKTCLCSNIDRNNVKNCTEMLDGTCKIDCATGYIFNTSGQKCEKGPFGFTTGYIKL